MLWLPQCMYTCFHTSARIECFSVYAGLIIVQLYGFASKLMEYFIQIIAEWDNENFARSARGLIEVSLAGSTGSKQEDSLCVKIPAIQESLAIRSSGYQTATVIFLQVATHFNHVAVL